MKATPERAALVHTAPVPGPTPDDVQRRDAFAASFASMLRPLWLVAFGIVRNGAQADDIVQDAALIALGKLTQFRPGTNLMGWMVRIVRYVAANHMRAIRRKRVADTDLDRLESRWARAGTDAGTLQLGPAGSLSAEQLQFDDEVLHALAELGATPRTCLLLRTVEGLAYPEIAALLKIPAGTAMSHVFPGAPASARPPGPVEDWLCHGQTYLSVATSGFPRGEIRGQIVPRISGDLNCTDR